MARMLFIILLAFLAAVGAAWLADNPGRAVIDWNGWRLETTAAIMALLLLLAVAMLLIVFRLTVWLLRDTPFAPERRRERRQRKGAVAVNLALTALAAGRIRDAHRQAEEGMRLLGPTPITLLLRARAAEMKRDDHGVHEALVALAGREDGGLIGYKALLVRALAAKDLKEAKRLLLEAAARDPEAPWVDEASFEIAAREGHWEEARQHLKALRASHLISDADAKRLDGTLAFLIARDADLSGKSSDTLRLAREALRGDPRLTPAAVLAARAARRDGRSAAADDLLAAAWRERPHPDLIAAALEGYENETAAARYRRIVDFVNAAPEAEESRLARAAAAIECGHWQDARRDLAAAIKDTPSSRVFELMAMVEEGQSSDRAAAAGWRDKAAGAPTERRWMCGSCGSARDHWVARCPSCGSFATHDWRRAEEGPLSFAGQGNRVLPELL